MNIASPGDGVVRCPACNGLAKAFLQDLYDDRYGYPRAFTLYKCGVCGHMTMPTGFTPADLGALYTQYYPRGTFDIESFRPERERKGYYAWLCGERGSAFRWVPENVRVLDIGCGIGATLAYHKARGCEAIGIEADENVQVVASRYGLDIRQGIFDGTQFETEYFDYVTLDQVAEHALDPVALLVGVARVLKSGGKIIITTPNPNSIGACLFGRKWLNWHTPYHIQFYTRRSLNLIAKQAGLQVLSAQTLTASEWQYYQWQHIMQFPAQGAHSGFWSPGHAAEVPHPAFARLVAWACRNNLHRWISRLLDILGVGDNQIFILRKP